MSSMIMETYDPTTHLGSAPAGGMGETMENLKGDCGWIINAIDWVVEKFWQPGLREAIITKLAGDFNALDSMKQGWVNVSLSLEEIGENYAGLGQQLPAVWEGKGGTAASSRMGDVRAMHGDQAEAAQLISEQLGNLIDVSVAAAEVVVGALHLINDILQELISDAALPLIGWAKALITGADKVRRAISLIQRCLSAIERITSAIQTALKFLTYFNAGMSGVNAVLNGFETATAANAGSKVDETAERGFA
ncbi:hypothetical protein [Nocardioides insulae]|uniref:hypothetical protein n=1 Tax=Nocardioides insulae TaxID=394734 RepID=UPI000428D39C|nr:hypothetical protein [Nocardioides insulae]